MAVLNRKRVQRVIIFLQQLPLPKLPGYSVAPGLFVPAVEHAVEENNQHERKRQHDGVEPGRNPAPRRFLMANLTESFMLQGVKERMSKCRALFLRSRRRYACRT